METQTCTIKKTWQFLCYDENLLDWAPQFPYTVTKTVGTRPCLQGVPVKHVHYVGYKITLSLSTLDKYRTFNTSTHKYLVDILDKTHECPIKWEQSNPRITGTLPLTDFAMYNDHSQSAIEHEEQTLHNIQQWLGEIYDQVLVRMRKESK